MDTRIRRIPVPSTNPGWFYKQQGQTIARHFLTVVYARLGDSNIGRLGDNKSLRLATAAEARIVCMIISTLISIQQPLDALEQGLDAILQHRPVKTELSLRKGHKLED